MPLVLEFTLNELCTGLYLFSNQLCGHIPTELGNLAKLQEIELQSNEFTGPIPSVRASMINSSVPAPLVQVLAFNAQTDCAMQTLGRLTDLRILALSGNDLSGRIPTELGRLLQLTDLSLRMNSLTVSL